MKLGYECYHLFHKDDHFLEYTGFIIFSLTLQDILKERYSKSYFDCLSLAKILFILYYAKISMNFHVSCLCHEFSEPN